MEKCTADRKSGCNRYALEQVCLSPLAHTKFCVGAVLVDADKNEILSTGYSMELPGNTPVDPGNTHAEQCCFIKVAQKYNLPEERIGEVLPKKYSPVYDYGAVQQDVEWQAS